MIEQALYDFVVDSMPDTQVTWGKLDTDTVFDDQPIINFFKVPSQASSTSPTYYDGIQFNVRHKYIDVVQENINKLVELFQLYNGYIGDYQVWISSVVINGTAYEEEDLVVGIIQIGIKYTLL